ncbi:septin and tuftelin-interacting protein 1 homolog 1-like [Lolium rigidum]|uniref:septin and tuftelin-interacting protein 1 homolog 1-like n=1 Tax=Lolium rigidum TaxID=89674 RepID=UPI001F5D922E|nr:septin and tuftelin-interacting protein 1 homolog 1-like [Lolium rigidum]
MALPLLEPCQPMPLPGTLASTSLAVARMLRRWNFKEGSGLGPRGKGIVAPVQAVVQQNQHTGIGYSQKALYDNGLPDKPPVVEEEWRRRCEDLCRVLALEEECCEKTIAMLRDMTEEDDISVEAADALAAIMESKKVKEGRTPGMWKATLPSSTRKYIVEEVIKPAMAAEAQEWKPSWDPDCHHWLRPWIPLIGHLPEDLYDTVESKILSRADELDYHDVVSPWKDYMHPTQWNTFTRRHILPMLTRLVRELMFTPPKQIDPSLQTAMLWAPLVPVQDVVSILEEELFFDRYEDSLRHWMQSGGKPPLSEAVAWCTGWKNFFTPELLAEERVLARLDAVMALVDGEAYLGVGTQKSAQALLVDCMHRLVQVAL